MPLYEYECQKCGEKFEFWSRLYELNRDIRCPRCGGEKPVRVYTTITTGDVPKEESCNARESS